MRFSLAGIDLGSAAGASQLTPMDIVDGATAFSDPAVLNLSRFLQSLDADGNLGNGIEITADIKNAISDYLQANPGVTLDFADSSSFEPAMNDLLAALKSKHCEEEDVAPACSRARQVVRHWRPHRLQSSTKWM